MASPVFLAVDIGSSSTRALLFDHRGKIRASATAYPQRPAAGLQDAESVWSSVVAAIQQLPDRERIAGIGVAAQLATLAVDQNGQPLHPAMTWMDRGAMSQAVQVAERLDVNEIYQSSGKRLDPERDVCKWLWLKEQGVLENARWLLSLKDYIVLRLTGQGVTDPVHASYTCLYDVATRGWRTDFCRELEIAKDLLPPILPHDAIAGHLIPAVAMLLNVPSGVPVVVGGPDGTLAVLGAGVVEAGQAVIVMGTSDVVFALTENPIVDDEGRIFFHPHALPGMWLAGGPMGTSGAMLEWIARNCGSEQRQLEEAAAQVEPGARGLLVIPSLTGERAPLWNPAVRGSVIGLGLEHTAANLYRAACEGTCFRVRIMVDRLKELGVKLSQIRAIGGGSRSDVRCRLLAQITGIPLIRLESPDATACGAALLAATGAGFISDLREASSSWAVLADHFELETTPKYERLCQTYRKYYDAVAPIHEGMQKETTR